MKTDGSHVIADIWLDESITKDKFIKHASAALKCSKMTVLGELIHDFGGEAFTGIWLLAESHFSIHYFPERKYAAVDCFTCGKEGNAMLAICKLSELTNTAFSNIKQFQRG